MAIKSSIFRRWWAEMKRGSVFHAGERVGVGVSGGPDSVLLFDFMTQLARQQGLVVSAVHFNHRLRGHESDQDEEFVRHLARERGCEFFGAAADVAETARRRRRNLEATARELRYRYFFSLISQGKLDKVATAHNANDQAETVLLRLLRGAGTRGLAGIYPALEGKILRPFLGLTRAEIEQEVARQKLEFRQDATNRNTRFRRNKIRLELLPLLEREYSTEAVRLLSELAARARDDEAYLEEQAREKAKPWRTKEGSGEKVPVRALLEFPPSIARRVIRQMIHGVPGTGAGPTYRQIEEVRRFAADGRSGRAVKLGGGIRVRKEFNWLIVERESTEIGTREYAYPVTVPGEITVPEIGTTFQLKIVPTVKIGKEYNTSAEGMGLNPRRVRGSLILRSWKPGDRYRAAGKLKAEKLKELFRERKIAAERRRGWPVLEAEGEILWVKGFPPAEGAAAVEGARQAVVIRVRAGITLSEDRVETKNQKP